MKKLILAGLLALAVIGGTVAVSAFTITPVAACPNGTSDC